ncbi:MAG: YtxH domain-containing protein [Longimonas sp.]|uniref:YtxH domain-containing protein n=1 Tax=Longimonas sp. TaxID=2039626 RepID=UPI00335CA7A1
MSDKKTTRIPFWSVLISGAIGFGLGMLFAPQRGPNARRRIAYQLDQFASQTGSYVRGLASPSSRSSEARRTRDALVADAQARANNIRNDIDSLLDELKKQQQDRSSS